MGTQPLLHSHVTGDNKSAPQLCRQVCWSLWEWTQCLQELAGHITIPIWKTHTCWGVLEWERVADRTQTNASKPTASHSHTESPSRVRPRCLWHGSHSCMSNWNMMRKAGKLRDTNCRDGKIGRVSSNNVRPCVLNSLCSQEEKKISFEQFAWLSLRKSQDDTNMHFLHFLSEALYMIGQWMSCLWHNSRRWNANWLFISGTSYSCSLDNESHNVCLAKWFLIRIQPGITHEAQALPFMSLWVTLAMYSLSFMKEELWSWMESVTLQ